MSPTRKNHPANFKTKVALAALREDAPISELALQYGVHATVIHRWKRAALSDLPSSFGRVFGSNLLMSLKKSRAGRGHASAYICTFACRGVVGGVIPHAAKRAACRASGRARCSTSCPPISCRWKHNRDRAPRASSSVSA